MANKKQTESTNEVVEKKKPTKKTSNNTTSTKKTNISTKKINSNKTTTKKVSEKNSTQKKSNNNNAKKTTNKTAANKYTTTTSTKKNIKSKTTTSKIVKDVVLEEDAKVKSVELAKVIEKEELINNNGQKNVSIEEINRTLKIEDAKYPKKKDKKLLAVGIFIVVLGIIALFVSLVANRIVDREFLSDNAITLMMVASIIIEGFGAFIIINES